MYLGSTDCHVQFRTDVHTEDLEEKEEEEEERRRRRRRSRNKLRLVINHSKAHLLTEADQIHVTYLTSLFASANTLSAILPCVAP